MSDFIAACGRSTGRDSRIILAVTENNGAYEVREHMFTGHAPTQSTQLWLGSLMGAWDVYLRAADELKG